MYEGDKVKVLTVIGKPIGTITRGEFESGSLSPIIYWVRLKDGILLKDVRENELEFIKTPLSPKGKECWICGLKHNPKIHDNYIKGTKKLVGQSTEEVSK